MLNIIIKCVWILQVHSVDWSCDGQKLASGSYDRTVCVFTLDKDRLVWPVQHVTLVENVALLTMLFCNTIVLFEYSLVVS